MPHAQPNPEHDLIERIFEFRDDPLGFIHYIFPWGQPGTPLADYKGPRGWQAAQLEDIAQHCADNSKRIILGESPRMYRESDRAGRGIGKSAQVGMLSCWFLSTRVGASEVVTANNETQLKSRTLPEIRKWLAMGLNAHWFEPAAMHIRPAQWLRDLVEKQLRIDCAYYYLQAQLWSEEKPDAFAGLHNPNGVLLVMDESSGIPKPIWDVSEGFFTEPTDSRFWLAYSNPRRNEGCFYLTHTDPTGYGRRWRTRHIDSRSVEGVDKEYFQELVDTYGEESNVVRVEVMGEFPRAEDDKVIPMELVDAAMSRDVERTASEPWVWGLDPARFGGDKTALLLRQGNHVEPITEWKQIDTMQIVGRVKALWDATPVKERPVEVMVDAIGIGAGVADRLRELDLPVVDVNVSESPAIGETYLNLRAELWFKVLEWLKRRDCKLPDDPILKAELTCVGYEFTSTGRIKLESKEKMRKEGRPSPNRADALALTFAGIAAAAMGRGSARAAKWNKPLQRNIKRLA